MTFAKFWERVQNFVPGTAPDLKMPDNKVEDLDWDQYLEACPGDQLHINVMAGGDQNMKWDCKLPHEKWNELDDNQLKSAIRNMIVV